MTFLNAALVFGAAAFLIPLIIHILNRSRFKTVEWGAMHLLESVIKVNHRRFRVEQLILLLVRCLIPVLLAICLARPVLTGATGLQGDAPVSLMVILDNSYSMEAAEAGSSRFKSAIDAAVDLISSTPRGSEMNVLLPGGKVISLFDQPVFDSAAVVRRLQQQRGGFGALETTDALEGALMTLAKMSHARRELLVISDFQKADWRDAGNFSGLREQVAALDIRPAVTLLPVGKPIARNISVEEIVTPNRAIGAGQRIDIRATIRNADHAPLDNVRVVLLADGEEQEVSQLSLPASGSTQVLFPCSFTTPGSHTVEIRVAADDPLQADNAAWAAVTIWDKIPVLLIDGDPRGQPLQSEADFLSIALTPFTFGRAKLTDLVATRTIKASELQAETLKDVRVVVLANVSKLDDSQVDALTSYVREGGSLLITPGDRLDLNWYREKMVANGSGLLPAMFGPVQGDAGEQVVRARIAPQHFEHLAMDLFNDPANGDLSVAEIRRWYKLELGEDADLSTLARLDTGDPLIVEKKFGAGVVIQWGTTIDADWNDLPTKPVYVPLVQQVVTTMTAGLVPPRNIETGEEAVALLSGSEPLAGLVMQTPEGGRRTLEAVPIGSRQIVEFRETHRPGIYALSVPPAETIHFVAETDRSESDLTSLNESELKILAERLGATVVQSTEEYLQQDSLRRHGREFWRYVLALLLGLLFLEMILQQRFARVRT